MESSVAKDKPWKENLNSFLKDPTLYNLQQLLHLEAVEDNDLEFKRELLPYELLAKHILAMANTNGGAIVFGVEETGINQFFPCSLSKSFDVTDIEKGLGSYIPRKLDKSIILYIFIGEDAPELNNKAFLIITVKYNPRYIPFVPLKEGDIIKRTTIYIRRNRASEPINHDELQEILNNRIDTEYSATNERKLIEHLEELKELYRYIPKTIQQAVSSTPPSNKLSINNHLSNASKEIANIIGKMEYETSPNPDYPEESYESFIKKLIEIKKDIIIKLMKKS